MHRKNINVHKITDIYFYNIIIIRDRICLSEQGMTLVIVFLVQGEYNTYNYIQLAMYIYNTSYIWIRDGVLARRPTIHSLYVGI